MSLPRLVRLPALLLVAVLLSCHRPGAGGDGAQVEMKVIPQPPVVGTAEIEIFLRDEKGNPLEATRVEIEGNMTHPGMTPTFWTAEPQGSGRWVGQLELTMGGDWLIEVDVVLDDGRRIHRTLPLPHVKPR